MTADRSRELDKRAAGRADGLRLAINPIKRVTRNDDYRLEYIYGRLSLDEDSEHLVVRQAR